VTSQTTSIPVQSTSPTRRARWLRGLRDLFVHAVVQDRVLSRLYPGVMHFLIFWGMTIQILGTVVNLLQQDLFLPFELTTFPRGLPYLGFELVMDVGGGMILLGVLMAFFRRLVLRPKYLVSRWDDWYVLSLLFIIVLIGFSAEALRLQTVQPEWRAWSPIGSLLASGFTAIGLKGALAVSLHSFLFWAHVVSGLLLVASLPFTKLRHLITGPLNIFFRPALEVGELEPIRDIETAEKLGAGEIDEFQSSLLLSFEACVQCGRCEDVCPATFSGMPYSPRALVYGLHEAVQTKLISTNHADTPAMLGSIIDKETPWLCTTCGACLSICPIFVNPVSAAVEMRRYLTLTTGEVPGSVAETLTQMERRGNPWGLPKEDHAPYLQDLGVRILQPGDETDTLLFLGCAFGYDTRSQEAGRALIALLQEAQVDFAVLGAMEGCCGDTARRLGHEYVFQVMAEENIATFESVKFRRIVTPCAHGYNTLKNEYRQFGGNYVVQHHTELLAELVEAGRLNAVAQADPEPTYTYHDACYLGRYNQIYDPPRKALDGIAGLKRNEMPRNRANGFCCGGGGGHMWMEIDPNTRINHRRLSEAVDEARADVVVTACPYCLIMFDDAIRSKGLGESVSVKDISEVLYERLRR
jgi:Fe-S oxidoreductase/nitrate reductase gamma subunit